MIRRLIPVFILLFSFNFTEVKAQVPLPARNLQVDSLTLLATWDPPKSTLLEEGFEGDSLPANWSRSSMGQGWDTATVGVMGLIPIPEHGRYMLTNDGEADPGNNGCCDYLITPILDLTGYGNYQLSFRSFFTGNYGQLAYVKMSTDGGQNWTLLKELAHYPAWRDEIIDLSAYSGSGGLSSVQFAFQADDQGSRASGWAVDDVEISSDSLGVETYYVYINMAFMGQTTLNQFQISPPLSYRHFYNLRVIAVFPAGNSPEATLPFTSWYLPPPESFTATAYADFIEFSWDPPIGSTTIDHYNLYLDDSLVASVPFTETSYLLPWENGEACLDLCTVHDLSTMGYPGQTGESARVRACGYVDSSVDMPLYEDWSSGLFTTNRWTAGSGWEIDPATGNEAPSVAYTVPSSPGVYSSPLSTWYYDATNYSPCDAGGIVFIFLDFDLLVDSEVPDELNRLQVQLLTEDGIQILKEYQNDGNNEWRSYHKDLFSLVAGHNFRIRFVATGNSDGSTVIWHLDNINLYWAITDPGNPMIIEAHRTGSPENDILVSWLAEPSANTYTYLLDDNSSEDEIGLNQPGEAWFGNVFQTNESGMLKEVSLFFNAVSGSSAVYSIDIFDEDKNLTGSSSAFTPVSGNWMTIYLPDIHFNSGFYAMLHIQATGPSDRIAIDTNGPNASMGYAWVFNGSAWYQHTQPGVFLIRLKAQVDGDSRNEEVSSPDQLECDTIGYSVYRKAYSSYPPGSNSGSGNYEWIGCSPKNITQFLDLDLENEFTNCYEYSVAVIYRSGEGFPSGTAWDCIFVSSPEVKQYQTVRVYPNPANDYVSISVNNDFIKGFLLDIHGKRLSEFSLEGKTIETIFTGTYPDGIYLLGLQKEDGSFVSGKLVVRH